MKSKSAVRRDTYEVLQVVRTEILFGNNTEPGILKDYLMESGFTNIEGDRQKIAAKAPRFMFCTFVPGSPRNAAFQMFSLGLDKRAQTIFCGQTWLAFESALKHKRGVKKTLSLSVRGDVKSERDTPLQINVVAKPLTRESERYMKRAEKKIDKSDKIAVIKSLFFKKGVNPVNTARIIEEVLAEHSVVSEGRHDRSGRVSELSRALEISTAAINRVRATLALHPSLHKYLEPGLSTKDKMTLDCVALLVRVDPKKQVKLWKKVSTEKTSRMKAGKLVLLVPHK